MLMFLCRKCLQLYSLCLLGACAAGIGIGFLIEPQWGLIGLGLAFGMMCFSGRSSFGTGWLMGSARFANRNDLMNAGYVGGSAGLLVGQCRPPRLGEAMRLLFKLPTRASSLACILFFSALSRRPLPVRLHKSTHSLICAPTGAGKGVSIIIPFLLTDRNSAVVIDPKGENQKVTNRARAAMGHTVVHLAPFGEGKSHCFNPLLLLDPKSPNWLDDALAYADALVIRTNEEKEPHWNNSAVLILHAVIAFLVKEAPLEDRNLQEVATIATSKELLAKVVLCLRDSSDHLLARLGNMVGNFADKELASVLTTVARHLSFLNSGPLVTHLSSTTFSPRKLRDRMTVYLTIPPQFAESHRGLWRLYVTAFMRLMFDGLNERRVVNFVLDEAAMLGKCEPIKTALAFQRGYGARLQVYLQSLAQLEELAPGQAQTLLSNFDNQIFFGVNDFQTAEFLSRRIGQGTFTKRDVNSGYSHSRSTDHQGHESLSRNYNSGQSLSEVSRSLANPDEILGLDKRVALVFAPDIPTAALRLARFYERGFRKLTRRFGFFYRLFALFRAFILACVGVGLVALAGIAVKEVAGEGLADRKGQTSGRQPVERNAAHQGGEGQGRRDDGGGIKGRITRPAPANYPSLP